MAKKLKPVIILLVGIGLGYWFINGLDLKTVGGHLKSAQIWPLIAAYIAINLTMFSRSFRWKVFLDPIAKTSFKNIFAATAVGFGSVFILGRAGEIVRPAILSLREKIQPSATIAVLMIERIFDTTAVVTMFAVNLLFFTLPPGRTITASEQQMFKSVRFLGFVMLAGVVCGILTLIALRLKSDAVINFLENRSASLPQKIVRPLLNLIKHLTEGLSVLLNVRALLLSIFHTLCVWTSVTLATWLTLYAFGVNFSVNNIIFILGFGLVGSVVPTPGGSAGAFHTAVAKGFEFLGLEHNLAASIAIVYHLIAFGTPFIFGLYYLVRDDIKLSQLKELLSGESVKSESGRVGTNSIDTVEAVKGESAA